MSAAGPFALGLARWRKTRFSWPAVLLAGLAACGGGGSGSGSAASGLGAVDCGVSCALDVLSALDVDMTCPSVGLAAASRQHVAR